MNEEDIKIHFLIQCNTLHRGWSSCSLLYNSLWREDNQIKSGELDEVLKCHEHSENVRSVTSSSCCWCCSWYCRCWLWWWLAVKVWWWWFWWCMLLVRFHPVPVSHWCPNPTPYTTRPPVKWFALHNTNS